MVVTVVASMGCAAILVTVSFVVGQALVEGAG
jgi:hypothetical protein